MVIGSPSWNLVALGVNHQRAPLAIREKLAFSEPEILQGLTGMIDSTQADEGAIVSTCNRTEIYCSAPHIAAVKRWLEREKKVPGHVWQDYAYVYVQQEAVKHLFEVASGMDSLVVGEPQILGQIKRAYYMAQEAGTLGRCLTRLFHHAFAIAKKIRSRTAIGAHAVSLASAGCHAVRQVFSDFQDKTVLCLGAGETMDMMVRHVRKQGVKHFIFCNRTPEKAQILAHHMEGRWCHLGELPNRLWECDWVITATSSPLPVLGKGMFETAMRKRKHRPICVLDLAVPRDVEKEVGNLPDVYYFDLDYLQQVIQHNQHIRLDASEKAVLLVEEAVHAYVQWVELQEAVTHIRSCRDKVDGLRQQMQARAKRWLARGIPPEAVTDRILRDFAQKLLHHPMLAMREAASAGRRDMLEWADRFFIDDQTETENE